MEYLRDEIAGEVDWDQLREELGGSEFNHVVVVPGTNFGIFYPFNTGWSDGQMTTVEKDTYALAFLDYMEKKGFRYLESLGLSFRGGMLFRLPETFVVEVWWADGKARRLRKNRGECSCRSRSGT